MGEGADASALTCATASAQAGTPTLLLDIRHRPVLTKTLSREALIEEAKKLYIKECDKFVENGIQENMDVCSLAYFHDVLVGDGNAASSSAGEVKQVYIPYISCIHCFFFSVLDIICFIKLSTGCVRSKDRIAALASN